MSSSSAGVPVGLVHQHDVGVVGQHPDNLAALLHAARELVGPVFVLDFYNRRCVAGELESDSFASIAQVMGAEGVVVEKLEDVGPALERVIDMQMNEGKTCVI